MFVPTAVTFGVVGLTWRRWPARLQGALVPAGFVLVAVGSVLLGFLLCDGGDGGAGLYAAFVVISAGMRWASAPLLRVPWRTYGRSTPPMRGAYSSPSPSSAS